ncbi:MAG TPA: hypothetical protein VFW06_10665 [Acidimicrobiia bacterium]|nr:hypothetical protein [Acidimicrobiia bacterium]
MLHAVVVGGVGVAPAGAERASAVPAAAENPARWDPRVRELVRFVERERKLSFDHPIDVEFLDDPEFVDALAVEETAQDRKLDRLYAGDLHALGLVGPEFDLRSAVDELDATGVFGFYDDEQESMTVRGQDLDDVVVRATVVHELTHALQDQTFDFRALRRSAKSSGADFARTALIEGDATWVEEAYVATLPVREQDEYEALFELTTEPVDGSAGATAPAIDLLLATPYSLGYSFVAYLQFTGGTRAVNHAFREPPPSDEHIVDPVSFLGDERPDPPTKPTLAAGEVRRGGADEIGVVLLYFVLATRLDPRVALAASTGWKGDRYVGFTRDDVPCIRAVIRTDGAGEARELADALVDWAGSDPLDAVSVERRGPTVRLDACGVADAALPTETALLEAADALSTRFLVYEGIEDASATLTPTEVRCVTDLQITDPVVRELLFTPELTPQEQRRLDRRGSDLAGRCGLVAEG